MFMRRNDSHVSRNNYFDIKGLLSDGCDQYAPIAMSLDVPPVDIPI